MYKYELDDIVNKHNNTYRSTIKMNPVNVKSSTYIDCNKNNKKEDPELNVSDHVRISDIKIFLQKLRFKLICRSISD